MKKTIHSNLKTLQVAVVIRRGGGVQKDMNGMQLFIIGQKELVAPFVLAEDLRKIITLRLTIPVLLKNGHKIKNGDLKPENVVSGSHNKAWWKCSKGHEWNAVIKSRTNGHGCPYCSGRKPSKDNNLKVKYPDIAEEWHPNKNGDLRPEEVTCRSNKKIWWICSKGHERYITVDKRTSGRGCPHCHRERKSKI